MLSLRLYVNGGNIYWADFLSSGQIIKALKRCFNKLFKLLNNRCMFGNYSATNFALSTRKGFLIKSLPLYPVFSNNLGNTETTLEPVTFDGAALFLAFISAPLFDLVSQVHSANTTDPYLLHLHEQFQQGKLPPPYSVAKGILYFNGRFVLSTTSPLITLLLQEFHDTPIGGHARIKRTLVRLAANFFWLEMRQSVINYISQCPICQQIK